MINETAQNYVTANRPDIDNIAWDEAAEESYGAQIYGDGWTIYTVPVEAVFEVDRDGCDPADAGMNHGTLEVVIDPDGGVFDYSVGDWTHGAHPDLHTFER